MMQPFWDSISHQGSFAQPGEAPIDALEGDVCQLGVKQSPPTMVPFLQISSSATLLVRE